MHEEPSKKSLDEQVVMPGSIEAGKPAEADVPLSKEVEENEEQVMVKNAQAVEEKINVEDKPAVEQVQAKTVQSVEEKIEAEDKETIETTRGPWV